MINPNHLNPPRPVTPRKSRARLRRRRWHTTLVCVLGIGALVGPPGMLRAADDVDLSALVRGKSGPSPLGQPVPLEGSSPPGGSTALGEPTVLTADAAFPVRFAPVGPGRVRVSFDIQPGYYLYRDKFAVVAKTDRVRVALRGLPEGVERDDAVFGMVPVFTEPMAFELTGPADRDVEVELRYQGCAEVGICYQPQKTRLILTGDPSVR